MKLIDFNLNSYIAVKLTEAGIKELERQHNELAKAIPSANMGKFVPYNVDDDGYTKFQGWNLMQKFGHMMPLGHPIPFELDVKIQVGDE